MALTLGTNSGFVTTAPTADPFGLTSPTDDKCIGTKHTSPSGEFIVTEIGWYDATTPSEEANFEVGIYTHDSGNDEPQTVVGSLSTTNAKGTGNGWHVVTGLNITISSSTIYWICLQLDDTPSTTSIDVATSGGNDRITSATGQTALPDPTWDIGGTNSTNHMSAIYALVEDAPVTGTKKQINISDAWKTVDAMQINIGDAWKTVDGSQVNIGDAWKTVF